MASLFRDTGIVSANAAGDFISALEKNELDIHSIIINKDGRRVFELSFCPYTVYDKMQIYSLSKTFTATAIGFAVQEKLLNVSDKVTDIFKEETPAEIPPTLAAMTVKHLLTMNTGHTEDITVNAVMSDNWVKTFLLLPPQSEPGSIFMYNTAASYMLSAIITKKTGLTLMEYLTPRLFTPLGIEEARWELSPDGCNEGGFGLHISCEDAARFGQFYFDRGVYNGKRLLFKEWFDEAIYPHSDNGITGRVRDWGSGYGYQLWLCENGAYRGDGAFGQLCYISEKQGIVASVFASVKDMQIELDVLTAFCDSICAEGSQCQDDDASLLKAILRYEQRYLPPASGELIPNVPNGCFMLEENGCRISSIRFKLGEDGIIKLLLGDGRQTAVLQCGRGSWVENQLFLYGIKPALRPYNQSPLPMRILAAYTYENDALILTLKHMDTPHDQQWKISFSEDKKITVSITQPDSSITCMTKDAHGTVWA